MKQIAMITALAMMATAGASQAATIATEDFEGVVTGWTDNSVSDPGVNAGGFTRHLGRFGGGATSAKTFALSGAQSAVTISFDFYRFDSWDGETFTASATATDGSNSVNEIGFFFDGGPTNVYNPSWTDRKTPLSFVLNTSATSFTLTFSSTLDQGFSDESWGVDNLLITDNSRIDPGPGVPEPSSWALMILGFGTAGAMLRRRERVAA
jgi:hypothetical protein